MFPSASASFLGGGGDTGEEKHKTGKEVQELLAGRAVSLTQPDTSGSRALRKNTCGPTGQKVLLPVTPALARVGFLSSLALSLVEPHTLQLMCPLGQTQSEKDKQGETPGTELELVPLWKN